MKLAEVMSALEAFGSEATCNIYKRHGAPEPFFGVKVGDMKKIVKKIKVDHELALQLYATGNGDAMYLAGMIANPKQVTPQQLQDWAEAARWYMVGEFMVSGLAAESPHGWTLGNQWIDAEQDHVAAVGWTTLAGVVALEEDQNLDLDHLAALLVRVGQQITNAGNRTRYTMNGFVISVGSYVLPLTDQAMALAKSMGKVKVDMGGTACKVPHAPDYLQKMIDKGYLGKKRKKIRC